MRKKSFINTPFGHAALTLTVLLAMSAFLPEFPVWITDNGNKYIVMRNWIEHGTTEIRQPAPPELFPDGGFHFVRHRSGIRSFHSEYYPILSSFPYRWFGERALIWLSMIGTAATVGLFSLFLGTSRRKFAPLLAFATPMLFFSFLLWEMTWSVFFVTATLVLVEKKHFIAGGLTMGASLLLREEAYCAAPAMALALTLWRGRRDAIRFAAGFMLAALPLWVWQYIEFGHVLGLHGGNYYANNRQNSVWMLREFFTGTLWNYYHHLFRFDAFKNDHDLLCLTPVFAGCILGAAVSPRWDRIKSALGIVASVGWAVLVITFVFGYDSGAAAFSAAFVTGAIGSNPLFFPFIVNWRKALCRTAPPFVRTNAAFVIIYLLIVPPLLTRADIGLIYGARHFLCIMPSMLFLSTHFVRRSPVSWTRAWYILAVSAVALQLGAFNLLRIVSWESRDFELLMEQYPERTVVTDAFFLPEQVPHLFFTKTVLQLGDRNRKELIDHLRRSGNTEVLLILSNRYRRISDEGLADFLNAAPPIAEPMSFSRRERSGFMDLYIVRCRLK